MSSRRPLQQPGVQPSLFDSLAAALERHAIDFSDRLRDAAEHANTEEDIRVAVERQLAILGDRLSVRIEGSHEYTLLRGHVDSVYGSVFIEYKDPSSPGARLGPKLSSPGTRKVVDQIQSRFKDLRTTVGGRAGSVLGVGCDGRFYVFVRYSDDRAVAEEPAEVSRWSTRRFLWALFNLGVRGFALTPRAVAQDFGSESGQAKEGVRALAEALATAKANRKVSTFFQQWRILFGEVCGYDLRDPKKRVRELASYYLGSDERPLDALFALHTYYALFMKLLAAHVASFFQRIGTSPLQEISNAPSAAALRQRLQELEDGGIFRHLGVTNFLEGDLFAWYLAAWGPGVEGVARRVAGRLLDYNPGSLRDSPAHARDLLKRLYHELFPRQLRHDLGEFYTPDWLAELTLDRAGYDGDPRKRLLDPACGSGTFLVLALARIMKWLERNFESAPHPGRVAELARDNLIGFDLNPLAVLAARTNFLVQFYDQFDYRGPLELPIYLCDSVLTPSEHGTPWQPGLDRDAPLRVPTSADLFLVPRDVVLSRDALGKYCNLLSRYAPVASGFDADDFVAACRDDGVPIDDQSVPDHERLFRAIRTLDRESRNGVWARFIKNAFAPVFLRQQPVDFVVGNPPWVNWESLPGTMEGVGQGDYRQQIADVFRHYGLFTLSGTRARLGGGKKDLCMLFVYTAVDHYLKDRGTLAFVITQSVFKTQLAAEGFRRLDYRREVTADGKPDVVHLQVKSVDDLSAFQPFEGARNRTAVLALRKNRSQGTRYPLLYRVWRKTASGVAFDSPLSVVKDATERVQQVASPLRSALRGSPWLTAPRDLMKPLYKVVGDSDYVARAGCCTWLNGVYWVVVKHPVPAGLLIENLHDVGRIPVLRQRRAVESDLVYPLLRGRDVKKWCGASRASILLTNDPLTREGIPEDVLRRKYPLTFAYLKAVEAPLRGRSGFRKYFDEEDPFYSVYNVGSHTLADAKVVWREQSATLQAAVIGREADRAVVPDHKLMVVHCPQGMQEAHYLAGLLNSTPARAVVKAYVIPTSTSTHVLKNLGISRFSARSARHRHIAASAAAAQQAALAGDVLSVARAEQALDVEAAALWDLDPAHLERMREYLGVARPDGAQLGLEP